MNFIQRIGCFTFLIATVIIINVFGAAPAGNKYEVITAGNQKYLANTVVVKLKETPYTNTDGSVQISDDMKNILDRFEYESVFSLFPNKQDDNGFGLNRVVMIKYNSNSDPFFVSSKLKGSPDVEWAEPKFVYEHSYVPNDPSYGSQWNLSKINAALAWDVTKGDTNVIIGIIDTGVDWDHPDLAANIWMNWDEVPNNGLDDDNNGFIDDIRGWDFGGLHGDPDNNPMEDRPDHGTHVAGISSAVTDNGTGIASIGFNSKIMAVKTTIDDERGPNGPYIIFGFVGIIYAADNGAKVINCSWGGGGYSIFGQDAIYYAISKGALVVCAAGNDNSSQPYYPSYYDGVLSVASTTSSDTKSGFSNYGTGVDVSAPGSSIYSTWMNNIYTTLNGTSMSSPLAAGLAALVFAQFPSYTPLQVGEQVRVNSDNIDGINPTYTNLIGFGRINAQTSVSSTNSISVRATDFEFTDDAPGGDGDGIFESGETISLAVNFINYLSSTSNLNITLESKNNFSTVINGSFSAGARGTLEEFNNNSDKFTFTLSNSLPVNSNLSFLLHFKDGSYEDYLWASTIGNPTYATQYGNNLAMTITSKGTYGFNDYPVNIQGDGFSYMEGSNLLFEGALILGTSATQISDAARGSNQSIQNADFSVIQPFVLSVPGTIADIEGSSIINDDNAGGNKLGITAHLNSYTFTSSPNENYIILDYRFINTSGSNINNLFSGLFFDWDFADAINDYTEWDPTGKLGFVNRVGGSPDNFVGIGLISSEDFGFWAIKNDGDSGFQIYDGFDDSEKWQAISSGLGKLTAGPGDVSHVVSAGPFTIAIGDTQRVAFAVLAGDDQNALREAIANARTKYGEIIVTDVEEDNIVTPTDFALEQNYPNPFNPSTKIKFSIPKTSFTTLKIYDVLGNEVAILVNEEKTAGIYDVEFSAIGGDAYTLPSGIYFYRMQAGNYVDTKKMILLK
jgi:subtilisin family serine protease